MKQQALTISEDFYNRLRAEAQLQGVSIEQLLEKWEQHNSELKHRQEAGLRIKAIREMMTAKCGLMPDSAELIREDRDSR